MSTITNNKLPDERVSNATLIRLIQWADQHNSHYVAAALCELQERRKADSDPVGEFYEDGTLNWYQISDGDRVPANRRIPLYRHAQPVPERERIRREHAEWSNATFGDVGPIGPLKHLSKEALEAAADPSDPLEWADMQFLLWDAQRRMGISDEFITRAMIEKLEINKTRQWPEPKDGEPRLHIKEQPALVATGATYSGFEDFWSACKHPFAQDDELKDFSWGIWNACRSAMLQSKYRDLSQPVDPQISEYEKIMLRAGWVMVPVEPTDEMIAAAMNCEDVLFNSDESFCVQFGNIYEAMLLAAPQQEVNHG
ncbi:DUF550 domain-containing protein [Salmonella enterica subsp. arizonae]